MSMMQSKKPHAIPEDAVVENLKMEELFADSAFNCRGDIIPMDVIELAQNIQLAGQIQPIIVRPYKNGPPGTKYQVVAGYRRHMAHVVNKAEHIKGIIVELNDLDAKIINLSENLNREDLNLFQEAKSIKDLLLEGMKPSEVGDRLNKSRGWVNIRIGVMKLPKAIQEDIKAGWINQEHITTLVGLSETEQYDIAKKIKDRKLDEGSRTRVILSKKKLKKDPTKAAKRDQTQIGRMLEHILTGIGSNFGTRCLAWAAGNISTEELYKDIEDIAEEEGITYFPPKTDISCEI
jgi:ParB/RepB/Spo0J family partition protein